MKRVVKSIGLFIRENCDNVGLVILGGAVFGFILIEFVKIILDTPK